MTINKQQTVVEWLAEQIRNYKTPLNYGGVYFVFIHQDMINRFEKQAKEMEKEQMIRFALFYSYGQDNVSEQLRTKIEKWYDKIFEGGEQ